MAGQRNEVLALLFVRWLLGRCTVVPMGTKGKLSAVATTANELPFQVLFYYPKGGILLTMSRHVLTTRSMLTGVGLALSPTTEPDFFEPGLENPSAIRPDLFQSKAFYPHKKQR